MKTQITLSQAVEGFLLDAHARRLSPRTLTDYEMIFRRFLKFTGDQVVEHVTADDVRQFLSHLGKRRISPRGIAKRPTRRLSKKTLRNYHIALSSLWTWATNEGFASTHVVRKVTPASPEKPAIEPFSREDVEAMIEACDYTVRYSRPGKKDCANSRPTANRDRAMILLLLDTGARASEICAEPRKGAPGLRIQDVNQRNLTITVWGKGDKERVLRVSVNTVKAIWRYLAERPDAVPTDPLFLSTRRGALTTAGLLRVIKTIGERAKVENAHPHRFRHTFAINFFAQWGKHTRATSPAGPFNTGDGQALRGDCTGRSGQRAPARLTSGQLESMIPSLSALSNHSPQPVQQSRPLRRHAYRLYRLGRAR